MKHCIISALLLLVGLAAHGQQERTIPQHQVIDPYRVEVTYGKTVHILFPAEVRYVDLGSTLLIAGKADGAQNVVRIKAAVRGFEGETNFTVILSNGTLYTFNAVYVDNPARLSIEMEDWLHRDPYSPMADRQMYVRMAELGGESPLMVNRIMYSIVRDDRRQIKTIGSKRFGIQLLLRGIYVYNDLIFLHTSLKNLSKIPFDIDRIRFRIADRKVARRTAVQETVIEPVRVFNTIETAEPGQIVPNVYVLRKFPIPDDKVLVVDLIEQAEARHQSFAVSNLDMVHASYVNDLKLR